MFIARSNQHKLQYHIELLLKSSNTLQRQIQEIIYSHNLGLRERKLVFVTSVNNRLLLAKDLQYNFYYADNRLYRHLSDTKQRRILKRKLIGLNLAVLNIQTNIVKR